MRTDQDIRDMIRNGVVSYGLGVSFDSRDEALVAVAAELARVRRLVEEIRLAGDGGVGEPVVAIVYSVGAAHAV